MMPWLQREHSGTGTIDKPLNRRNIKNTPVRPFAVGLSLFLPSSNFQSLVVAAVRSFVYNNLTFV